MIATKAGMGLGSNGTADTTKTHFELDWPRIKFVATKLGPHEYPMGMGHKTGHDVYATFKTKLGQRFTVTVHSGEVGYRVGATG